MNEDVGDQLAGNRFDRGLADLVDQVREIALSLREPIMALGPARRVAVLASGLRDDFDVALLRPQRFFQPGRWCRQVDIGLEVDCRSEHFDAKCVEAVALV